MSMQCHRFGPWGVARCLALAGLASLLVACGGSGESGGGASGGGGGGGGAIATGLNAPSPHAIHVTGDTADGPNGPEADVTLTLTSAPAQWWYTTAWSGYGPNGTSILWTDTGNGTWSGRLQVTNYPPALMGAGTYTGTVTIRVCPDAQCTQDLPGSPLLLSYEYVVTGDPIPSGTLRVEPASISLESDAHSTATPSGVVHLAGVGLPPYGAYIHMAPPAGSIIATANFNDMGDATATITLGLLSGAQAGIGSHTAHLSVDMCYDAACVKPARGSPYAIDVNYLVTAVAGQDFAQQVTPMSLVDLAWEPHSQRLILLTAAPAPTVGSFGLSKYNPATGTVETSATLTTLPSFLAAGPLAVSDDGQYAYVGLYGAGGIQRVRLADLVPDLYLPISDLGSNIIGIKVAPGQPHTIAVELEDTSNRTMLRIYDDATARAQTFPVVQLYPMAWGQDASTLYTFAGDTQTFFALSATAGGLSVAQQYPGLSLAQSAQSNDMQYADGVLYDDMGTTLDTHNHVLGAPFGVYSMYGSIVADPTADRAWSLNDASPSPAFKATLQVFKVSDRSQLLVSRLPYLRIGRAVHFGSNGVAYRGQDIPTGQQELVVLSGALLGP
jgi:hypothetical protein